MTTRREFLRRSLETSAVISVGAAIPPMWLKAATTGTSTRQDSVLVVVQLSGGNDGLNTVIPFADPAYCKARPSLAIGRDSVLSVADGIGFHPSMRGMADLLEDDKVCVVQGIGYASPNRSHFESMDIWHTCRRKSESRPDGWLGRYLDAAPFKSGGDVTALHLGREKQPFALATREVRVPSIRSLDDFRLSFSDRKQLVESVDELSASARPQADDLLGFVQTSTRSALSASRRVAQVSDDYQPTVSYPESELAQHLRTVAQLIDAGLATRVYYVSLDGFDTHASQADAHTSLLSTWSDAVSAFTRDVDAHGHGDRVLIMSFSEFGRRVKENASHGTDHGAAAPVFMIGSSVKAGLVGTHPSLTDLEQGDLRFHTDFRRVYASVLENWLGWPSEQILGGNFETLDVIV